MDKLLEYKRSWIQHVHRMPRNRLPRVMKHYCPTGRRNCGRTFKRLLDTWDRNGSTSGPAPWQIYDYYGCLCHRHFFLVLLLNQRWSPPLRLQASHCNTFRIMCDVPSIAVFCSESIECFPGIVSKFFFKLLVTIQVAPIITGTIVHFRFHIRCISIHKLLYFNFFPLPFAQHFCLRLLPHLSVCMFSLFCF